MAIMRRSEATPIARPSRDWDPFETMRELMRWDPFTGVMPRIWRGANDPLAFAPAFDVRETKDAYMFKADLPGFREQDVDINVTGNRMTISGKREAEQVDETDTYYCSERSYGSFTRSFTLPDDVNADRIEAELKDGILTLQVPKSEAAQPKRISVRGAHDGGGQQQEEQSARSNPQQGGTKP